jgi:hypothetical protein
MSVMTLLLLLEGVLTDFQYDFFLDQATGEPYFSTKHTDKPSVDERKCEDRLLFAGGGSFA